KCAVPSLNILLVLGYTFGGLLRDEGLALDKYFFHHRVGGGEVLWPTKTAPLGVDKDVEVFKPFSSNNTVM
ncbi:MAG: hypothetical protein ABSA33_03050, partial [Candidatus Micrarchaeaceae archaeon]